MPANKDKIISLEQKINDLQKELTQLKDQNDTVNENKKTTKNTLPTKNVLLRRRAAI
jgi:phage shock protein A